MQISEMNGMNDPQINPRELGQLYVDKEYDLLSERFIQVLEHFEQQTYLLLDDNAQYFVNVFVKIFLYFFTDPDYTIGDRYVTRFIQLNLTISNLVAMSSFKTTDAYLEILKMQQRNFAKFLTLYSARNSVKSDREAIFTANPQLACLWYSCFCEIYRSGLVNQEAYYNLQEHLAYEDERLTDFYNIEDVYFGSTYIDSDRDKNLKRKINQAIQKSPLITNIKIANKPNPKKIAVITSLWFSQHSVYRTLSEYVESLQADYDLTLIYLGGIKNNLDIGAFKAIRYIYFQDGKLNLDAILDNDFLVVYYPDIGMSLESILLSNLRIAPIQICGTGHPVSTSGSEIDYFITGDDVEISIGAENNYSERLILLPGFGAIHKPPIYEIKNIPKDPSQFIINCSWYAQKVNYHLLEKLQRIVRQCKKEIRFRFFSGPALTRKNDFLPFVKEVESILGKERVEVIPAKPYDDYMTLMEAGNICLEAYHFGGSNTVADSLYLRKATVAFEGNKWYNRIGAQMLRSVGLSDLIARNDHEYIALVLRLIQDDFYREGIEKKLQLVDLNSTIFSAASKNSFKQAIDFLIANHDQLKMENSQHPIRI